MKCPKCQSDNEHMSKFCLECGHKLEVSCPLCGEGLPPTAKFCGECGYHLAGLKMAPAIDLSFEEKLEKLQRYLPGGLTDKILSQRGKIEGERKQVTVMFCDAEGFSRLSEKLGPEEAYAIVDEVFETLVHRVHEHGGTINKMTGDGVMALFGAPIALEDAPQRAIRSALAIQREIAKFSDRVAVNAGTQLIRMRIGIHTGPVVVGSLGNDLRVEFTAVGDTVNLASRVEGLAGPGTIYVTEDTFKLTEGLFRFEALGERQVKGREAPVSAYRVIAPSTRRSRFDVSAERGLIPFLGRERELELLLDGLDRAKTGRGQAFSIVGEAGVGKSRLLYEFRKAVTNLDVLFLEGRCLSYSSSVAYHPISDVLKSAFDIHEGDDERRIRDRVKKGLNEIGADDASNLPFILELLSVNDSGVDALGLSPEARKERTLEVLRRIVLKHAETRPLVMAIEDLHWADKSSEEALRSLLDAISGAQVLLVFTYRPAFAHTWGGKSYHNQVNLNRLSNRETLAMAAHILGNAGMGSDLEELVLEKTEGIPFFVEEFMKSLKDLGLIEWKDSGYYLAKDLKDVTIPSTIQDVIMARVDALPEGTKNVLQTGAAIGREFSCELIELVTGIPERDLNHHLSALRDTELLYERGIYPQATYVFRHSLTQEVAYDSLLAKRKADIHGRTGQAIETLYPNRLEEFCEVLAHHYSRGSDWEKAYHYLRLSGDRAARNYANWEAFRHYREAVTAAGRLPENEDNRISMVDVLLLMEGPMKVLAYPEDSLQVLHEGERLLKELGDERSLATIYSCIGLCYAFKGEPLRGIEYAEKCFDTAERIEDVELMAQTAFDLCSSYSIAGEYVKTVKVAPRVLELLEKTRREPHVFGVAFNFNLYSALSAYCGHARGFLGDFEEGEALCENSLRFARQIDNPYGIGFAETMYGILYIVKGDGKNAVEHLRNAVKYGEEAQIIPMLSIACGALGYGHWLQGNPGTARECIEKGLQIARGAGLPMLTSLHYWALSAVHFDSGDLARARSCVEEALKLSQSNHEKHIEGPSRILLGRITGKTDSSRFSEAEESILQGIRLLEEWKLSPFSCIGRLYLGELYSDEGQTEKALKALEEAETEFKDMGMEYWRRKTQEVRATVEG